MLRRTLLQLIALSAVPLPGAPTTKGLTPSAIYTGRVWLVPMFKNQPLGLFLPIDFKWDHQNTVTVKPTEPFEMDGLAKFFRGEDDAFYEPFGRSLVRHLCVLPIDRLNITWTARLT